MARFGDIARIEARGSDIRVTLKSGGPMFDLDRYAADDLADDVSGVGTKGAVVVEIGEWQIRAIDLLSTVHG